MSTVFSETRPRAMSVGTVKTFDASQGQGLIRPADGSQDVQFHLGNLKSPIRALFPGQKISFAVQDGVDAGLGKGPVAVDVEAADGDSEPQFLRLGY